MPLGSFPTKNTCRLTLGNSTLQIDGFCTKTRFDPFHDICHIRLPRHLKLDQNHILNTSNMFLIYSTHEPTQNGYFYTLAKHPLNLTHKHIKHTLTYQMTTKSLYNSWHTIYHLNTLYKTLLDSRGYNFAHELGILPKLLTKHYL